ncbi:MAG: LysM peptidoglycan-binding domain-containing protein [Actinomycetota bacterium]
MTRTRVRFGRGLLAGALAASAVLAIGRAASGAGEGPSAGITPLTVDAAAPEAERYVVRPGDTLWEIARRWVGAEEDPRPLITQIVRANGLIDSRVLAGQSLLIPSA